MRTSLNAFRMILLAVAVASQTLNMVPSVSGFTIDPRGSAALFSYNGHYYERRHINGQYTGDMISFDILKGVAASEEYLGVHGHLLTIDDCDELAGLQSRFFGLIGALKDASGVWRWADGPTPGLPIPACLNILPDDQFTNPECAAQHVTIIWAGNFQQQPPSGTYNDFFRSWDYPHGSGGGSGCGFTPDIIIEYDSGVVPTVKNSWGQLKVIYR